MGYEIIKGIMTVICMLAILLSAILFLYWLVLVVTKNQDIKKRKKVAIALVITFVIYGGMMLLHFIISVAQYT